jgi:geranylgeranylglycerol-phosphate geranylgeranyltransferase
MTGNRLAAHFQTWRPYTLGYIGLVGLAGAALAMPDAGALRLAGAWAVPTLAWLGGHYGGDYFDRELDALAKPHRPIPSGRMRPATALAGMVICVSAGGIAATALNWRTLLVVAVALIGGIAYSKWLKARGIYGNLVRGSLTAAAFFFGTMAVQPLPPVRLMPVAALLWIHDTCSNLVGTLRDADGDRQGGYRTVVVQRGLSIALSYIAVLYGLSAGLSIWVFGTGAPSWAAVVLLGTALALGGGTVVLLACAKQPLASRTALRAHEVLVVERVLLAGAFIAYGWGTGLALIPTAAVLAITVPTQWAMRERYEIAPQPVLKPRQSGAS